MSFPLPAIGLPVGLQKAAGEPLPLLEDSAIKTLAKLIASGVSPEECAQACGLTQRQVQSILNFHVGFQKELREIMEQTRDYNPKNLLRAFLVPAILTCNKIMNSETASASDRLNAAKEIMNRVLGKAVEFKGASAQDPMERLESLTKEINRAKQQLTS